MDKKDSMLRPQLPELCNSGSMAIQRPSRVVMVQNLTRKFERNSSVFTDKKRWLKLPLELVASKKGIVISDVSKHNDTQEVWKGIIAIAILHIGRIFQYYGMKPDSDVIGDFIAIVQEKYYSEIKDIDFVLYANMVIKNTTGHAAINPNGTVYNNLSTAILINWFDKYWEARMLAYWREKDRIDKEKEIEYTQNFKLTIINTIKSNPDIEADPLLVSAAGRILPDRHNVSRNQHLAELMGRDLDQYKPKKFSKELPRNNEVEYWKDELQCNQ